MGNVHIVSHRLPVSTGDSGRVKGLSRSAGGLVSGLRPVWEKSNAFWIGTLGAEPVKDVAAWHKDRLAPVSLDPELYSRYYHGFSNGVLWPLCHYFLETITIDPLDYAAYTTVNRIFAEKINGLVSSGDHIWIHDYHLMLLPKFLRELRQDIVIGYFLHIPFPSSELFRMLPMAAELLDALCHADLVGVHTFDYARHFVSSCKRVIGAEFREERLIAGDQELVVDAFPLGVDFSSIEQRTEESRTQQALASWKKEVGERKVLLGVDRMDYSKGIPYRLRAYKLLLERYPFWRDKLLFVQLAVPTREDIPRYQELKNEVEQLVGEINGLYGRRTKTPIQYMYTSVLPEELYAMYQLADVLVVTPLRDGMNLVAKEYIASRREDTGVLILSKFAGASAELGEALTVNPLDEEAIARAMHRALHMEFHEQAARMQSLRTKIQRGDVHRWAQNYLDRLEEVSKVYTRKVEVLDPAQMKKAWTKAKRRLLFLDYDGTLRAFTPKPEEAAPSESIRRILDVLAENSKTLPVIISGRDRHTIGSWLGDINIYIIAEHGLVMKAPGSDEWKSLLHDIDVSWKKNVRKLLEEYIDQTPGTLIEEKEASLVWHYRNAEPEMANVQAKELIHHVTEYFNAYPIEVMHGNKNVEIRVQGLHKGLAYSVITDREGSFDFLAAFGDDRTDEDLFSSLPKTAWTVKVGSQITTARYRVSDTEEVESVLNALVNNTDDGQ